MQFAPPLAYPGGEMAWFLLLLAMLGQLNLDEAQQRAVTTSPVLREYRSRVNENLYRVDEAYTQAAPTLNLNNYYLHQTPPVNFGTNPVILADNFSATLSLRQAIYTFGRLEWSSAAAELQTQASQAELAREEAKVKEEAALAYYDALLTREQVVIARDNLTSREAHLSDARKLEEAGVVARFDRVRDEAAFAKAGQGLLEASNRRDVARARLFILIGEPRTSNTTLAEAPAPSPPPEVLQKALDQALTTRPEMLAASFAVDAAHARVELAEAQDNPSLHFQSDLISRTANAIQPGNTWQAGIYFSIPLFDGGVSEAKANQAREVVNQLEAIRDNLRRSISLEVESLYLDLVSRWQRVTVASKETEAATEAARVARLRYLEGISSNVERLDAESALTSAQLDLAGARYQYLAGLARWRRAVP